MKAIACPRYGSADVLELRDVDTPLVGDDDVLVRVRAASVNRYDWHSMTGVPYIARAGFGLFRRKLDGLGADLAGQVEAVGTNVTTVRPGDEVFGEVDGEVPGQPLLELGSFAEYVCVSPSSIVPKPAELTFEQVAAVPLAGTTALQGLRDQARLEPGQRVLINGASGGVGTFAVQIAKALGAEVTGVCGPTNVEMVRSIGADRVLDYTREDFSQDSQLYDVMLDNVGNRTLSECRRIIRPTGIYVASFGRPDRRWLGPLPKLFKMSVLSLLGGSRMVTWVSQRNRKDLLVLSELLETQKIRPVIDRVYPLSEVPDAMRHLGEGHASGKIIIGMGNREG